MLDERKIKEKITKKDLEITILEKTESTNDSLKNNPNQSKQIQLCLAEMQTHGRGRLNRSWHSPSGLNIYFSMQYRFQKKLRELSGLSLIAGLATCHAIETITHLNNLKIKWPNDILVNQQKIAGILIDINTESNQCCTAIIGIGINVNMQDANITEINQPWSSLQKITGQSFDRNALCATLINALLIYCERFCKMGLSDFMGEWAEKDCLFGQSIMALSDQQKIMGTGAGINTEGHLILTMPDQTQKAFSSGEIVLLKQQNIF